MKLKELRDNAGMTQQQMARKLGVARTTIAMWETGKSMPRVDMLPKLARLYGCRIDDLLTTKEGRANDNGASILNDRSARVPQA